MDRIAIPADRSAALERALHSDQSPVGIDAKKTHVAILHRLLDIQDRLTRLEACLDTPS